MMSLPRNIAVLMGGPGSERDVSFATAAGVSKALRSLGCNVTELDVRDERFDLPPDVEFAFIAIHGTFGEDGQLQRILDGRGIPYSGDGAAESELAFDKIRSKRKFRDYGVTTPDWEVIQAGQRPTISPPLVAKAPREGSTVGVSIIHREEEMEKGLAEVARHDHEILVEKFIAGRELTIGVLGKEALPVLEIIPKGGFYDFNTKYPFLNPQAGGSAEHVCPAKIDPGKTKEIQDLSLRAFHALDLRVYGRVDVILTEDGVASVLEINTIPGMTEASLLPDAAAVAGINYVELCRRIVELSQARQVVA